MSNDQDDAIDFAIAAWREEGRWNTSTLPLHTASSYDALVSALHGFPGEGGVFAFLGLDDACLVALRVEGGRKRALIGDGVAILDFDLLDDMAEGVGLEFDEDELEELVPVGDLGMFADFGLPAEDVAMLCDDEELFPEDLLRSIAKRLGFAEQLSVSLRSS